MRAPAGPPRPRASRTTEERRAHGHRHPATTPTAASPGDREGPQVRRAPARRQSPPVRRPARGFDAYLVGFHPAKDSPDMQMEAHHYCKVVDDDLIQCVLFDGNTSEANLIGIEYIVSESLFDTLPEEERSYWHPHNYEILSGQLIAPGLPAFAEQRLMAELVNSYGKTWHTWHTGRHDTGGGHPLPLGDPMLMWSFNRDGESDPDLASDRARVLGLDPDATRERRRRAARPSASSTRRRRPRVRVLRHDPDPRGAGGRARARS
ncbi:OBAP family protein [Brachybacterium sp. GPGPB12]|uniref:OBAP family protein n=1 Tax=Brachybacterium sp. GPGPB12 TaxID=3023517 RepID=UPI0031343DCA